MEKNIIILTSEDKKSMVKIDNGELISYQKEGQEYIHQKENEGWNNSDTEMFPIIGPTFKNNYQVNTPNGNAILDQHGILRNFEYNLLNQNKNTCLYKKEYKKESNLLNTKYPNKSPKEFVFWTYDFLFIKKFILTNNTLEIIFELTSEKNMPFMLGYHPAFELTGFGQENLIIDSKKITLKDVLKAGGNAYPILNSKQIILQHSNKKDIKITTKGFNNFMLWTEVNNMICIEPITQYPDLENQKYSEQNMRLSTGFDVFSIKFSIL